MTEPASPRKAARLHALVRPCDDEATAPGLELDDLQTCEPAPKVAIENDSKKVPTCSPLELDFVQQNDYETKTSKPTEAGRRSPDQSGIPSISNLHPSIRVRSSYTEMKSAGNSASNSAESSPDRIQKTTPSPKELRSSFGFRGAMHKKRDVMQAGWEDIDSERSDSHGRTSTAEVNSAPSPLRSTRKALTIETEDFVDDLNEVKHASSNIVEPDSSASPVCEASLNSGPMEFPVSEMADTKLPYSPMGVKRLKYNVKPPKTPSGSSRYDPSDTQDNLSATQRVRVGLSEYIGTGTPDKSRLIMDKSQQSGGSHGPASCPPMFHASGKQQFSAAKASPHQGQDVRPSKLLPSQNHVNCLMGYIHELHQSESSLRVQLATFKQQADTKLANALARHILLEQELSQSRKTIADQQKRIRELTREVSYGSEAEDYQLIDSECEEPDSCSFELCDSPPSLVGKMEVLYRKSLRQNEMIANSVRNQGIQNQERWDGREMFNPEAVTPVKPASASLAVELGGSAAHQVMSPTIKPLWKPWSSGGSDASLSARPPMFTIASSTPDGLPQGSGRHGAKSSSHPSPCLKSIISTPGKIYGRVLMDEQIPLFESSTVQNPVLSAYESKTPNGLPPLVPVKVASSEQKVVNALDQISESGAKCGQLDESLLSGDSAPTNEQISSEKVEDLAISQENVEKASPLTLEQLLLEFYKENDKPKESMAHVYAKRYQGRESWLFTELSKRYSKVKVAALKDRFAECAQCVSDDTSSTEKVGRRSMHELSSALKMAMEHDIRSPSEPTESLSESAANNSPTRRSTQKVSPNARKVPLYRASMTPVPHSDAMPVNFHDALKSADEEAKTTEEESIESPVFVKNELLDSNSENFSASTSAVKGSADNQDTESKLAASRPPPIQPTTNSSLVNSKASPILRPGELSHGGIPPTASPVAITKELSSSPRKKSSIRQYPTCSITLEALLMDLYRSHQPNELRNVQQVADEYRGNERELIVMLKSKYGALSVKRLEENLATLDKLAQAHSRRQSQKRFRALKTGAKLVLAAAVGVASCAVGISLVHSQLCHGRSQSPETQQRGNGSSCLVPSGLAFGVHSAALECSMTPVDSIDAFCAGWMDREESWLTTHSMTDALELLNALRFSPLAEFPYKNLVDRANSLDVPSILGDTAKSVVEALSKVTTPSLLADHNDSSLIHLDDSVHEALTKAALASKLLADSTIALVSPSAANASQSLSTASRDAKIAGLAQNKQDIDEQLDVLNWLRKSSIWPQCPRAREVPREKLLSSSEEFAVHNAAESTEFSQSAVCDLVTAPFAVNTNVCTLDQQLHVQEFYAQDPGTLLALAEQAALAQLQSGTATQ